MKKIIILAALVASLGMARELSCRIRSLGDDLAGLVPDEETDALFNPAFLEGGRIGLYYKTNEETPIKATMFWRWGGVHGFYWPNNDYQYQYRGSHWEVMSRFRDRLYARALVRFNRFGLSLNSDLERYRVRYHNSSNITWTSSEERYLYGLAYGRRWSDNWSLLVAPALAFCEERYVNMGLEIDHKDLITPTGKVGVQYRRLQDSNRFVTVYLDLGGPSSLGEIDQALFNPVVIQDSEIITIVRPLYNTGILQFGVGWGVPVAERSVLVLGVTEKYMIEFVPVSHEYVDAIDSFFLSQSNRAAMAFGFEHQVNKIALRFGANAWYNYREDTRRDWKTSGWTLTYKTRTDALSYGYTLGFGLIPDDRWTVDCWIKNHSSFYFTYDWALNITYHY